MKLLNLIVNNTKGYPWIGFEKEDDLPFILPAGTIFEAVENYRGEVKNHYYDMQKHKFITNISVATVLHFQLEYFKQELLKEGWKVKFEQTAQMVRDNCS
ncbi:MAG TPA: hypothetical protein PK526_03060 [bacterium]|nr:hypothetical protein [bacterium]